MNCEKFNEYLDNYENLTDTQKLEMTAHTAECEACRKELDFMLSIIETAASLPKIEAPSDFMKKLNVRLDAEERKKKRISSVVLANLRRNHRQYTAAAACFALVAVITANSSILLDGMYGSDGDSVPVPTFAAVEEVVPVPEAEVPDVQTEEAAGVSESKAEAVSKAAGQPVKEQTPEKTAEPVVADETAMPQENVTAEAVAMAEVNEEQDYGIATASMMNSSTSPEGYAMRGRGRSMPDAVAYDAEAVQESYSLVEEGSIAHGLQTAQSTMQPEKAIGQLKISADDADEAMDVIRLYSYGINDAMYTTNSASLSKMLSDLSRIGVDYTNYIPSYDGDITFQLVIG